MKKFTLGFITGSVLAAAVTGFAVEYAVTANPYPVKVNGVETAIQGYNINDETYFKLRDVSAAVGGFEVGFENNAIVVNTPNKPTPTSSPTKTSADITIVKGEDGNDYTSDGLKVWYDNGTAYVSKGYIEQRIKDKGFSNYTFTSKSLIDTNTDTWEDVIPNIPSCPTSNDLIPFDYYVSTISPFINSL